MIVDCIIGLMISLGNALRVAPGRAPEIGLVLRTTKPDESGFDGDCGVFDSSSVSRATRFEKTSEYRLLEISS